MTFKQLRIKKKLIVIDVANRLGISESAYRKYESSLRIPKPASLIEMQKIFECSDMEILEALSYHVDKWKSKMMKK